MKGSTCCTGRSRKSSLNEPPAAPVRRLPGWLLLRAWNEGSSADILDDSPYATTNPVFFTSPGAATHCGADADYFLAWIDGLAAAARAHPGYNSEAERNLTLEQIAAARKVFESRR